MDILKKVYNLIDQESRYENEPKRILVLLRWLYLLMVCYFVVFFFLMMFSGPERFSNLAAIASIVVVIILPFTYRLRTKQNLILYSVILLTWVVSFVYLYGWDCGVQNFVFSLLVVIYFSVYDALALKIVCTVLLFLLRFILFSYCRVAEPLVVFPNSFIVLLQIYNSVILFSVLALICGTFSSNIESAEKKLVQYNEELRKQASTDPLTGAWNRRTMRRYIEQYRRQNPSAAFAVAMGDIDFFKRINDQWGHDCGDEVLKGLSGLFCEEMQSKGFYSRWGGEEFLFFFPEKNGDEAYAEVIDLLVRIQRYPFFWKGEELHITMTFGLEENDFTSELDVLIAGVDEKLYIGKERGRNQIIF